MLRDQPQVQAQLLDLIDEAVIGIDLDERIGFWNNGAERTYGWRAGEVLGRSLDDVFPPSVDHQGRTRAQRLEALRHGGALSGEFSVRRKDGATRTIEYNACAFIDRQDRLQGYVTVHRDVTERHRTEQRVRENEARLNALIEASPLGINIMDVHGNPVFFNPMCTQLHGIDIGEASGEGWEQAVHPEDRERIAASWYAAASTGRPWADTYRFLHHDGKVVWVSGRAAPIRLEDRLIGFVGTLEDISVEREARENAERAVRLRDEMLSIVAHDLRNPLTTILLRGHALATREWLPDQRQEHTRNIVRGAEAMRRLIEDLLDVARIEAGQFAVAQANVDLQLLCREAIALFEVQARARGISLACWIAPDLPPVVGDPGRLAQALSNLIGNALGFAPANGSVVVRAQRVEQGVQVSVEDNGPGISPDVLPHLFDRFARPDRFSRSSTGLGLSITKAVVDAHGGRIWAETAPGVGTTMHFTLPQVVSDQQRSG